MNPNIEERCDELSQTERAIWSRLFHADLRVNIPLAARRPGIDLLREDQWRKWLRAAVERADDMECSREFRGAVRVRNSIIESNMGLIHLRVDRFARRSPTFERDDLAQQGVFGLIRATEMFRKELGWRFSTYATWWIDHAIERWCQDLPRPVRIPVHVHDRVGVLRRLDRELSARVGRPATHEEILGVAVLRGAFRGGTDNCYQKNRASAKRQIDHANAAYAANNCTFELDAGLDYDDSNGTAGHEFVADINAAHAFAEAEARHDVGSIGKFLDHRSCGGRLAGLTESQLLIDRFGPARKTLLQIGDEWGVTRERVRQVQEKVLQRTSKLRREYDAACR